MARREKKKGQRGLKGGRAVELLTRIVRENGRKYLPRYAVAFVLMAIVAGMTGASAWIMKSVVNDIFIAKDETLIWAVAGAVFFIFTVRGLADYGQTIIMNSVGRRIIADQQKRLYTHLIRQGMDYFNNASLGEIVTRVSHSSASIRQALDLVVRSLGKDFLSLIALGVVMVMQDPFLSLFALVFLPLVMFVLRRIVKRIREVGKSEYQGMSVIVSGLKDTVLGIRVVKSFGMEERLESDMQGAIDAAGRRATKLANLGARSGPLMETLAGISLAAIILYAGFGIVNDQRDAGSLFAFITAVLFAYEPAKRLARLHLSLETALVGVGIVYDFLDKPLTMTDRPDAKPLAVESGTVELRDVSFSYDRKTPAIAGMNVTFPAGKVSALVGSSGAGKSTIFSLIERFYDPQKGQVLVDGQDVRDVTMASLRAHIAYVTQESFLFEGTIRENIRAGRPDATDEEIVAAARAANAHEFIAAMPKGYDNDVGEGGGNLSGGQRQRIAIARAMLRDAPILLLDEATSALDAASEAKVKEALDVLMKGRTTIVIAHRLSTVRNADVIHVIEDGRLVESGTHERLIAASGTYAHLTALQFAGESGAAPPKSGPGLAPAAE